MLSTLDYRTKYRTGPAQLKSRVVNLLQTNGKRAIDQGWITRFQRESHLPASLLWDALHVLTGWGNAAFNEPVNSLSLDGRQGP